MYVVSDLDVIQQVFVSQFARFSTRRMLFIHVFGARFAGQWTQQRRILNPTYSISKMKQLLPTLQACTNVFIEKLASTKPTELINIQELYLCLTMDIICE